MCPLVPVPARPGAGDHHVRRARGLHPAAVHGQDQPALLRDAAAGAEDDEASRRGTYAKVFVLHTSRVDRAQHTLADALAQAFVVEEVGRMAQPTAAMGCRLSLQAAHRPDRTAFAASRLCQIQPGSVPHRKQEPPPNAGTTAPTNRLPGHDPPGVYGAQWHSGDGQRVPAALRALSAHRGEDGYVHERHLVFACSIIERLSTNQIIGNRGVKLLHLSAPFVLLANFA